jgi:hypothetical protein
VSFAMAIITLPKAPSPSTPQTAKSCIDGALLSPFLPELGADHEPEPLCDVLVPALIRAPRWPP